MLRTELDLMSSSTAGQSRVSSRQNLPIQSTSVIERFLGNNRFVVSDADAKMPLKLIQRELNDIFNQYRNVDGNKKPEEIKVGELYLYCDGDLQVFRARILQVNENVSCRLIDFGICLVANPGSFYKFEKDAFDELYSLPAFVTRVNLPTDEVLRELDLPVSSMFKEGDFVDMISFTTTEPKLAVFARSNTRRFLPEKFIEGFNEDERKNWLSLFSKEFGDPIISRHGYGQLGNRNFHTNRLALIAYVKALDKVYVHDLSSSIRMMFLRERLNMTYGNEKYRPQFVIENLSELSVGSGCVAYHEKAKFYVRVEIIALGLSRVEVAPIDTPDLGIFTVTKESIFKIPKSLQFPRQCFSVRMTRHSEGQHRYYLSKLARCILPDKTPVIINSELTFGLVKIRSSNAPAGVLAKIGFTAMKESKFDSHGRSTKYAPKVRLGNGEDMVASELEAIDGFAEMVVKKKEISALNKQAYKASLAKSKPTK